ncbi:MAG: M48 family metallopeptidase [Arcobacter sp.]|nr:M48 family metallopeptidase [Arcobacter sp.]
MNNFIKYIFILFTILLFTACTHKAPITKRNQMILMSQSQELALGEKTYNNTLKKSKVIIGTVYANKIKEIGFRIAKVVNKKNYKWEFNLVKNKQKNAFCLPGGKVVVYTGILQVAKNEHQLATVISHEIAHALARHGAERVSSSMIANGVQIISNIALGSKAPHLTKSFNIAYGLGTQYGIHLPYGRLQENEADEIGIHLMHQAGYDINEALSFWVNMSKGKINTNEFFSTHPSSKTRIKNIKKVINSIKRSSSRNTKQNSNNIIGKKIK